MKEIFGLLIVVCLIVFQSSCYYDKEELLYPPINCDTVAISYASKVKPILETSCFACHSEAIQQNGIDLETFDQLKNYALNGSLLGSIKHARGYSAMPQGGSKLSTCDIAAIESWIKAGTPQN